MFYLFNNVLFVLLIYVDMKEESKWKDWMLILAENKFLIEKKEYDMDVYSAFKVLFDEVRRDGYIKEGWGITSAICPVLTDLGKVFVASGGYSEEYKKRRMERVSDVALLVTKETAAAIIQFFLPKD